MIQGVINARVTALYDKHKALAEFTDKLTQVQRDLARLHYKTLKRIKNAKSKQKAKA